MIVQGSILHIPPKVSDVQAFHFPHCQYTLTTILSNYFLKFCSASGILPPLLLSLSWCLLHQISEDFHIKPANTKQEFSLSNCFPWPFVIFLVGPKARKISDMTKCL